MFVILWAKETKYYTDKKKLNHWTDDIKLATKFSTLDAINNYIKNSLPGKANELEYLTFDGKEVTEDSIPTLTKEEAEAAYEELRKAAELFGKAAEKIPAITKYYTTIQSEQDKLQEDLLHKFEFTSPGNIIFVKLGRMLKACRIKRREAKDRLGYMIAIGDAKGKNILAAHNNHNRLIETRNYSPRIAAELFN